MLSDTQSYSTPHSRNKGPTILRSTTKPCSHPVVIEPHSSISYRRYAYAVAMVVDRVKAYPQPFSSFLRGKHKREDASETSGQKPRGRNFDSSLSKQVFCSVSRKYMDIFSVFVSEIVNLFPRACDARTKTPGTPKDVC